MLSSLRMEKTIRAVLQKIDTSELRSPCFFLKRRATPKKALNKKADLVFQIIQSLNKFSDVSTQLFV